MCSGYVPILVAYIYIYIYMFICLPVFVLLWPTGSSPVAILAQTSLEEINWGYASSPFVLQLGLRNLHSLCQVPPIRSTCPSSSVALSTVANTQRPAACSSSSVEFRSVSCEKYGEFPFVGATENTAKCPFSRLRPCM